MTKNLNISKALILLLATACGVIVANIYYSQTIIAPISNDVNMSLKTSGLIVTLTQLGYGIGLLFIVPLADRYENKSLILLLIGLSIIGVISLGLVDSSLLFLIMSFIVGVTAVAVQIIIPYTSHLVLPTIRGRVVGNVMSGLMLGIMLSRPLSSFITETVSWRAVFFLSALIMLLLGITIWIFLPKRKSESEITLSYIDILKSMKQIVLTQPVLRRRCIYQIAMFGTFSLFWTTIPLLLLSPKFGFNQQDIALFALASVSGAIAAPIAGKMADQDKVKKCTMYSILIALFAFAITFFINFNSIISITILLISAILVDFASVSNLVLGQREIFLLDSSLRSRINGIFMASFFIGGSITSSIGAWIYVNFGWDGVVITGILFPLLAFIYFLTE
ncbi:MFS transporter [Francisella tularensis subsp. novicida]|uniref:MFS transporter n=1 Tax=Francisella tularensis TaxID=263 RepID=UPI000158AD05|nr:MFS transporter [Francisella tularensis]AJI45973.1 sugar (and other) transporter family protein [Francisella tularensis subsp. novicida F6168]AJJ46740.1 sugar (and other) transporter family protein [Francisella tularensis subsp. novicida]APC99298.1 sugar (and other) transporter family protein [Francisella tularensis subsp. novicida]EDN35979.1 predicted protein [Francisella tularensis subsp. novicida GA99-3549]KFJ68886.1 sugar (and other) transporter family protein [Francisella tularensis su